ncbi:MAG: T9SS type A sorting domain-containing protein [Bacteroidales bacterium]|nr:T9SS type A sorting domain-containing protein [Bacteroidales bacterium]
MKKALLSLLLAVAFTPFVYAQRAIVPVSQSACETFTWSVNNQTYTTDTLVTYIDGDTIYVLDLTINTPYVSNENIIATRCSYTWRGDTFYVSDLYHDTVVAPEGSGLCDSIFNLLLTVSPTETNTQEVHTCGSYIWNGDTLRESGIYRDTIEWTDHNCTEYRVLNLNIVSTINAEIEIVEQCGDYTWHDSTYTESGLYTYEHIDTVTNCDTLHRLSLTIVVNTDTTTDAACASRTWRGTNYTETGIYSVMDTNATTHCVTNHVLDLEIKAPRTPQKDTAMTGCNSILFSVSTRMGSTTKRFSDNCVFDTTISDHRWDYCFDSTIHLNVTIHKSGYDTNFVNACDSFYWKLNKTTYHTTPETTPRQAFSVDTFGCDSIMVLSLIIKKAPVITAINGEWNLNAGDTAVLYPTCADKATYKWTYGNKTATGDTLRIPNVQGNIDVSLEATLNYPAQNLACHDTSWITIVTFVGINDKEAANVTLYPNPTVGQLNIESAENISQVTIFNALGQQVLNQFNLGNKTVMNLSTLAKGNYTMRLTLQNGETIIRKFIITK